MIAADHRDFVCLGKKRDCLGMCYEAGFLLSKPLLVIRLESCNVLPPSEGSNIAPQLHAGRAVATFEHMNFAQTKKLHHAMSPCFSLKFFSFS
ncbi:hypothetical protein Nepgr_016773 [Nepenthes gracilis]|uniref:Uncharacterized protein n=1 Tax=Nepenthes gracilis TaxID=150966 RepID=A0AAD3SPY6_NEPGR|nr:hypothetical protein Nepgr_016773 [Nepenthes gracilis]